jgi:hypothetical protein
MGTSRAASRRAPRALTLSEKSDILQGQLDWGFDMQRRNATPLGSLLAVAVLALGLAARGYGRIPAYELCLEESPAQAGKLTPDSGTHRFAADAIVVLSAEPQPGYQFAYWLGDVADPKAQRTTVQVNSPKVVVAVFQPARCDEPREALLLGGAGGGVGGGGGGKAVTSVVDLSTPGWSIGGGPGPKAKAERISVPIPAPVPAPVPEPATVVLFGLGALALRRRLPTSPRR